MYSRGAWWLSRRACIHDVLGVWTDSLVVITWGSFISIIHVHIVTMHTCFFLPSAGCFYTRGMLQQFRHGAAFCEQANLPRTPGKVTPPNLTCCHSCLLTSSLVTGPPWQWRPPETWYGVSSAVTASPHLALSTDTYSVACRTRQWLVVLGQVSVSLLSTN